MKFLYIFFLLFTSVLGRGLAGAYERMLFWRLYELEMTITNGKSTYIASGCSGSGPGGSCKFFEFMKYINNITKQANEFTLRDSIDKIAEDLNTHGFSKPGGDYKQLRIVNAARTPSIPDLFRQIGKHFKDDIMPKINSDLTPGRIAILKDISHSIQCIGGLRLLDNANYFENELEKKGYQIVHKVWTILPKSVSAIDTVKTKALYPAGFNAVWNKFISEDVAKRHQLIVDGLSDLRKDVESCRK
ncbi:hypothetical protein FQN57_003435 [Myotisia sp. PD_48]|nr:hypothetical protein FQN57_003435 [Myotisia sp. PD_48]